MKERIKLTAEEKNQMISEVKQYFITEREEELGQLSATLLLDFITAKLAPTYYNHGVNDAKRLMADKLEDLHGLEIWL